jgi:glycosyltransferase involved in cell wall biosynthesis
MRVAMIDTGNQTPFYVYPFCRALALVGCEVDLLTAPFLHGQLPDVGLTTHELFGRLAPLPPLQRSQRLRQVVRGLEYPFDWPIVLRRIARTRPEIVHVQWPMLPPVDALAFRAIKRLGPRLVYTVHDIRPHWLGWRRTLFSTDRLYQLADALVVHTETNRRDLIARAGLADSRARVIAQGNEIGWTGQALTADAARRALGLPLDAPLVLFFGVIKPYKGLGLLLEALPRVLQRHPAARLLVVGRPEGSFAPYDQQIGQLGLDGRVLAALRYVGENEKALYFSAADVVVLPYVEADFSGVLLAAYAFGRPVVTTDVGGLREIVEPGGSGYLVPPGDREALAARIAELLGNPELRARMGARASELAATRHDWLASARATLGLYQELLHDSPGQPSSN